MEKISSPELTYTGTQVNYYFVCKRKLWLFSRDLDGALLRPRPPRQAPPRELEKAFNDRDRVEIEYFSMEKAEGVRRKIDIYYKSRK